MKTIIIYDDTGRKSEAIKDIIGERGFSDVVVKKKTLEYHCHTELQKLFPDLEWRKIHSLFEFAELSREMELYIGIPVKIMHIFSNYLISDSENAGLSFKKLDFIDEPYGVFKDNKAAAIMFPGAEFYITFCKNVISGQKPRDIARGLKGSFEINGLVDIGIIDNFIQCITGNLDSRYFNSLKGNEYILTKSSSKMEKIKAEYNFYHLLPEDMKFWFVMPFNYKEDGQTASYAMERLHMTDFAIKWVHGSIDESEFEDLLDKYFFFFKSRHSKKCSGEEYQRIAKLLYVDKVNDRIAEVRTFSEFKKIELLLNALRDTNLDLLVAKYFELKKKIEKRASYPREFVIGHGDPCFSNALYNKSTKTLKFIDPKGANMEEELWTNPYYDVAKLSHSICGKYDFFNYGLFDIRIDATFSCDLEIPFDNSRYVEIFKRKVEENGFDYLTVRIYEASLFLSMLPLHIDNQYKVLGFILNVKNILKEIEEVV